MIIEVVSAYDEILYAVDDPVAVVTLNRPDNLNAWTSGMGEEVRHAVSCAQQDPRVVGIVITGAGRAFCAGVDLQSLSGTPEDVTPFPSHVGGSDTIAAEASTDTDFTGYFTYLLSVPKPIVAAINGPIAGMGVALALSCDVRIMANEAVMTLAFSRRGLVAEWGTSWLLTRLVGPGVALDLLLSSRRILGTEAARVGFASSAVAPDLVLEHAENYIHTLAQNCSPASMATMKRQVYQFLHAGLSAAEEDAYRLMVESTRKADFGEGVRSFIERRAPNFERIGSLPQT